MSTPRYKLTYFNGRGRAEIIRLVFAVAGVQYDDIRLNFEEWAAIKPTTPFGQVPTLDVDDVKLCQSNSIARYLARKYNLAGATELDQTRADMVVDCIEDILKPLPVFMYETDEVRKAELKKKYLEEQLPKWLAGLENILIWNHGGDGFFVGSEVTWADLSFFSLVEFLQRLEADSQLSNYAKLAALRDRVTRLPSVAKWIAERPFTPY